MGLDLRVLPVYSEGADFSCTSLEFNRDYDLFGKLRELQKENGRDVPRKGFTGYMGDNFGKKEEDAYGETLQSIQAKDFTGIKLTLQSRQNEAILAFLNALEDEHECFLYWH